MNYFSDVLKMNKDEIIYAIATLIKKNLDRIRQNDSPSLFFPLGKPETV